MSLVSVLRSLGPIDVRGIRRDRMLTWMVVIPVIAALVLRWGLPALTRRLLEANRFDLTPYYPALVAYFFVIMCPIMFGTVIAFLLLDEKDDNTLAALSVTPLTMTAYIAYRVAIPILLTIAIMFVIFPLANVTVFDPVAILLTAIAAAPTAPMFALYVASYAQNKVQGFALMKLSGVLLFLPIIAYFIHSRWEYAFGVVPTYWPMKVYWMLEAGEPVVWPFLLVAVVYQSLVTLFLVGRFNRVMWR